MFFNYSVISSYGSQLYGPLKEFFPSHELSRTHDAFHAISKTDVLFQIDEYDCKFLFLPTYNFFHLQTSKFLNFQILTKKNIIIPEFCKNKNFRVMPFAAKL